MGDNARMLTHWDDVTAEKTPFAIDRRRLALPGRLGLSRYAVPPGAQQMPVHRHADEEEIAFVLGGSGLLWQDGATHAVRTGDAVVHRAGAEAHTFVGGEDGLDVLIFGEGSLTDLTWLPRAQRMWAGTHWLPIGASHPMEAELGAGPLERPEPSPRPANVVALADVAPVERREETVARTRRDLGRAAGSERSGLTHSEIGAGMLGAPPHCHSTEDELFVVLDGEGTLELSDGSAPQPVRRGSIVSRPAGTGVAHAFRGPLELLAYGTRDNADVCFYPRSGNVILRGVGVIFRPERIDYWDGER